MHPCILDLSCPLFTKYMTLILHDIPASEVHYMRQWMKPDQEQRDELWTFQSWSWQHRLSSWNKKDIFGRQGWSSRLVIKVGRQGWSSRLVVKVGRQGRSSRLLSLHHLAYLMCQGGCFLWEEWILLFWRVFLIYDFRFLRTLEQASLQRENSSQSRSWTFLQPIKRSIFGRNMKASLYDFMIFLALVLMASDFSWFTGPEYHFS